MPVTTRRRYSPCAREVAGSSGREQVICLLVESKGHRVDSPAYQQIIDVQRGVSALNCPQTFAANRTMAPVLPVRCSKLGIHLQSYKAPTVTLAVAATFPATSDQYPQPLKACRIATALFATRPPRLWWKASQSAWPALGEQNV